VLKSTNPDGEKALPSDFNDGPWDMSNGKIIDEDNSTVEQVRDIFSLTLVWTRRRETSQTLL
jgi:hypothetical protein